jgi:hypothetical protein
MTPQVGDAEDRQFGLAIDDGWLRALACQLRLLPRLLPRL